MNYILRVLKGSVDRFEYIPIIDALLEDGTPVKIQDIARRRVMTKGMIDDEVAKANVWQEISEQAVKVR